jgi:hypothetical protein
VTQEQVLVDCLERLNRESIGYMLTGSMASNVWGLPRWAGELHVIEGLEDLLAGKIKPKTT